MKAFDCDGCSDTGVVETGSNDMPCPCKRGMRTRFIIAGVEGEVSGEEVIRHFLRSSPQPICCVLPLHPIHAMDLPGRTSHT